MITPLKGTTSLNVLLIKTIILAAEKQKFTGFVSYYRHKKHTQKFCAKLQPCKTFLKLWSESFCTRAVAFLFESYYYHVCDNFKLVLWVQMKVYIILWPMFRSLVLLLSWWYCLGERVGEGCQRFGTLHIVSSCIWCYNHVNLQPVCLMMCVSYIL